MADNDHSTTKALLERQILNLQKLLEVGARPKRLIEGGRAVVLGRGGSARANGVREIGQRRRGRGTRVWMSVDQSAVPLLRSSHNRATRPAGCLALPGSWACLVAVCACN